MGHSVVAELEGRSVAARACQSFGRAEASKMKGAEVSGMGVKDLHSVAVNL